MTKTQRLTIAGAALAVAGVLAVITVNVLLPPAAVAVATVGVFVLLHPFTGQVAVLPAAAIGAVIAYQVWKTSKPDADEA